MRTSALSAILLSTSLSAALLVSGSAHAQSDFPSKPVRIVLPYAPGGPNDILTRMVTDELAKAWKQQIIIEGKPGANGRIAFESVARSAPDGYTLASTVSSLATLPHLYKQLDFDPRKDLVPVTQMFAHVTFVTVPPTHPSRNLREFIDWVKANPGKVNFGTQGRGNIVHMIFELINKAGGVSMTAIHYKGTADVILAGHRGDLQVMTDTTPFKKDPQGVSWRPLAVVSDRRSPDQPNVPTMMETGLFDYIPTSWVGLTAPAGTPKAVIDRIAGDVRVIMQRPEIAERYRSTVGAIVVASTPEEFGKKLQDEFRVYGQLVKMVGIEPQ